MFNLVRKILRFTLIELLVVIAIISILAAMLMPALQRVMNQAQSVNCLSNFRQIHVGFMLYGEDNDGWSHRQNWSNIARMESHPGAPPLRETMPDYWPAPLELFVCPATDPRSFEDHGTYYPGNFHSARIYMSYGIFFGIGTRSASTWFHHHSTRNPTVETANLNHLGRTVTSWGAGGDGTGLTRYVPTASHQPLAQDPGRPDRPDTGWHWTVPHRNSWPTNHVQLGQANFIYFDGHTATYSFNEEELVEHSGTWNRRRNVPRGWAERVLQ